MNEVDIKTISHKKLLNRIYKAEESKFFETASFGFFVYLMTDLVLFASLFAVYAVLEANTVGGPSGQQIFNLNNVLLETLALLISSFTMGLAILSMKKNHRNKVLGYLVISFLLGLVFLLIEMTEFNHLIAIGDSWRRSGFLSGFFVLVGTHGLHIMVGLIWMAIMFYKILKFGLSRVNIRRLTLLSMFWHFLDIVWIFIFTIVYLYGALGR